MAKKWTVNPLLTVGKQLPLPPPVYGSEPQHLSNPHSQATRSSAASTPGLYPGSSIVMAQGEGTL